MQPGQDQLDLHLEIALEQADDETAQYHLREALQLRIAQRTVSENTTSV